MRNLKIPPIIVNTGYVPFVSEAIKHYQKMEEDFNRLKAITGLSDDSLREEIAKHPHSLEVLAEFYCQYGRFPDE